MALPDVAPILAKEFIPLRLDFDRGIGAPDIQKRYTTQTQGLPWFAFIDGDGNAVATSTAPKTGNVGFPYEPHEIAYFQEIVEKLASATHKLTAADVAFLGKSLQDFRKKLEGK